MKLEPFEMERMQSTWENVVDYNLSESGVHPIKVGELAEDEARRMQLLDAGLGYSQSNGTPELRALIAQQYRGATPENILVTNGSSEANYLVAWHLIEPGDEVVLMLPNYMQLWGLARGFGAKVKPFTLRPERNWTADLNELNRLVTKRTKAIAICNPNNPTGGVLDRAAVKTVAEIAEDVGAWVWSDEVYLGAERVGPRTPTIYDFYDKVLVTNGLSKAYGLPGLRIGWLAGPKATIAKLWSYHDYTTISPGMVNDQLARVALEPKRREEILARTRQILQTNYPILEEWMRSHGRLFEFTPPTAGAICFARYRLRINSTKLAERLIHERSVLIVPGDHFGVDHYVRIGYGPTQEYLVAGLNRIHTLLEEIQREEAREPSRKPKPPRPGARRKGVRRARR